MPAAGKNETEAAHKVQEPCNFLLPPQILRQLTLPIASDSWYFLLSELRWRQLCPLQWHETPPEKYWCFNSQENDICLCQVSFDLFNFQDALSWESIWEVKAYNGGDK